MKKNYHEPDALGLELYLGYKAIMETTKSKNYADQCSLENINSFTAYRGKVLCEKTQRSIAVEGGPEANYITVRIACSEKATYEKDFGFEVEKFAKTMQFCSTCLYASQLPTVFIGDEVIVYKANFNKGCQVVFIDNLTTF